MSITSTVPTVKAAIVTALQARSGLAGVQVEYADPARLRDEKGLIFFQDVPIGRHAIAAMRAGRKPRDETYTLNLVIIAVKAGGTPEEAEARLFELFAEVEDALADDPRVGLAPSVVEAATVGDWRSWNGQHEKGAGAQMVVGIDVKARLT